MADTTFVNGVTLTDEDWFNDVNRLHYTIFGDPSNAVTALANLSAVAPGQGILLNGQIVTSVGSNALTIAIKGADGNDPSSTNPVSVAFRSATLTTSGYTIRKITAALSLVVSSGSTLGHASALACHLFVYLIDNSGTVELAVSNLPPDYPGTFANTRLISTTAEGGAGAADSATGIYSTTARSNVPWVCVAMCKSTQTTAGTWAANMTQVDQAPFSIPTFPVQASLGSNQTISDNVTTKLSLDSEAFDPDGVFDNATNYRYRPAVAGYYRATVSLGIAEGNDGGLIGAYGYVNGSQQFRDEEPCSLTSAGSSYSRCANGLVLLNGTSDYLEAYCYQNRGSSASALSSPNRTSLVVERVSGGK